MCLPLVYLSYLRRFSVKPFYWVKPIGSPPSHRLSIAAFGTLFMPLFGSYFFGHYRIESLFTPPRFHLSYDVASETVYIIQILFHLLHNPWAKFDAFAGEIWQRLAGPLTLSGVGTNTHTPFDSCPTHTRLARSPNRGSPEERDARAQHSGHCTWKHKSGSVQLYTRP